MYATLRLFISFSFILCCFSNLHAQKAIHRTVASAQLQQSFKAVELFTPLEQAVAELLPEATAFHHGKALQIDREQIQILLQQSIEPIQLTVPLPTGITQRIWLIPAQSQSAQFQVRTSSKRVVDPSEYRARHYWGVIDGDQVSTVSLSVFEDEVMAVIAGPTGNHVIAAADGRTDGLHLIYNDRELGQPHALDCGVDENTTSAGELETTTKSLLVRDPNKCVLMYVEADNDIFRDKGSVGATVGYVTGLFNQVSLMFFNETVKLNLHDLVVWDTNDPYTGSSTSQYLNQFRDQVGGGFNGDLAHLVGYQGGGGIASLDVLCRNSRGHAYSGVGRSFQEIPTYSWSINVVTHEIGHNLGSRHTHDCVWNGNATAIDRCGIQAGYGNSSSCNSSAPIPPSGTVMSYCHLVGSSNVNLALGFGEQPGDLIRDRVYNADCLVPCDPAPEVCDDNFDNDFDGLTDCEDPDCDLFVDCLPCMETIVNVFIQFDANPVETYWNLRDDTGSIVEESAAFTALDPNSSVTQELCLGDGCYTFTIFDSGGNGLCCNFGDGFYQLVNTTGTVIAQGSQFSNAVTTEICNGVVQEDCFDRVDNDLDGLVDCDDPDCDQSANCRPCDDNLVIFEMNFNNFPQETSWEIIDAQENIIIRGQSTDNTQPRETLIEQYCLEDGCYSLIVYDSGGNGLCCNVGLGGYSLINTLGGELASGAEFGALDVTEFCISGGESSCQEGTTFVVSATGEGQANNLRQAIYCANGSAILDTIRFDLAPNETIVLNEPLPPLTDDNIYIDGGGQTVIVYNNDGTLPLFLVEAPFVTIRDLTITKSTSSNAAAVLVTESSGNVLLSGNEVTDFRRAFSIQAPNAVVANNNISADLIASAIQISSTSGNVTVIDNVVTGANSEGYGLWTDADDIEVRGNEMTFLRAGIRSNRNNGMVIAENMLHDNRLAIEVLAGADFGSQNFITRNSIFCNTENQVIALDPGANQDIQPPTVTELTAGYVAGMAVPGQLIEVYLADDSGCEDAPCQGKTYVGTADADGDGNWYLDELDLVGSERVVALASDLDNNSSAFSDCYQYVRPCPAATLTWTPTQTEICEGSAANFVVNSDLEIGTTVNLTYRFNNVLGTVIDYTVGEPLEIILPNSGNIRLNSAEDRFGCELDVDRTFSTIFIVPGETIRTERSESICPGSSVLINGETVTEPGIYQESFVATSGCDSIVDITVSFSESIETSEMLMLCAGQEVTVHGEIVSSAGIYPETYSTSSGCDSTHTVTVEVQAAISTEEARSTCAGQSVEIFGQTVTEPGPYSETFLSSTGCDSTHTINLMIVEGVATSAELQLCAGQSVEIFGQTVTEPGPYSETFLSSTGCDSTHTVNLTIVEGVATNAELQLCAGQSVEIFGQTVTEPGPYSETFLSSTGCDSTHTINLMIVEGVATSAELQLCAGQSVEIFGQTVTEPGPYSETFLSSTGCDSTHTINLMIVEGVETSAELQLCAGQSVEIFGQTVTEPGPYSETFLSSTGCDSTHTINLMIVEGVETSAELQLCAGQSVEIFGQTVTEPGPYSETFLSSTGCDSTHTINLMIVEGVETSAELQLCAGQSVEIFGQTVTESGPYSETFLSSTGCDSTHTVMVSITEAIETNAMLTVCAGETIDIFGEPQSEAGAYRETFTSSSGCDSIHQITLMVTEPLRTSSTASICAGSSIDIFGETETEAGTYQESFIASTGCDSIHTVVLTVSETIETTEARQACTGDEVEIFGEVYTTDANPSAAFTSSAGCDSTHTVQLRFVATIETSASITGCEGQSVEVFGELVMEAGEYRETFTSDVGCDSTHTIVVSFSEGVATSEARQLCAGSSIEVFGELVTEAGEYQETFTSSSGCDSTHTVQVSLLETLETNSSLEICAGSSVEIFGEMVTEAGEYQETFISSSGCDSTHTVQVSLLETLETNSSLEICAGQSVEVFGEMVSAAGEYRETFTSSTGCDSTHTVALNVLEATESFATQEICAGESIDIFGESRSEADIYTATFTAANGCDSIARIELLIQAAPEVTSNVQGACAGEDTGSINLNAAAGSAYTYTWAHTTSDSPELSGLTPDEYEVTVTAGNGCTSSLSLTVAALPLPDYELALVNVSCGGAADGSVNLLTEQSGLQVALNDEPFGNNLNLSGLAADTYDLQVRTADGCTSSEEIVIEADEAITIESIDLESPDCGGDQNGSIQLNVNGNYSFDWNTGQSGATLSGLDAGTYIVTISGGNGCSLTERIELPGATPIDPNLVIRSGCGEGEIIAVANPDLGAAPYDLSWSTGASGNVIAGLIAGQYRLTITDANDCELVEDFIVPLVAPFRVSHQATDATCADNNNGVANLIISGGVEPYEVNWSHGATGPNLDDLAPGTYTYNVSSDGCARAGQLVIDSPTPLGVNVDFAPNANGNIDALATAAGGRGPYTYQWNNGLTGRTLFDILPGTELAIEILDANFCSFTTTVVATLVHTDSPGAEQVFRLFPNPTSDALTIELVDGNAQPYDLKVYTAAGVVAQEWSQIREAQHQLSVRTLPAGVYFVAFQRNGQRWTQRVVVMR